VKWVLGFLVVLPALFLIVASVRGRVQVRSCCAVDAASDGRMAGATTGPDSAPSAR